MQCNATFHCPVSSNFNDLASSPAAPEVAKPKLESADDIEVECFFFFCYKVLDKPTFNLW